MRKQTPPFCIQVELTEGCNLYCNFCGLQGIRHQKEKNLKFMTVEIARHIGHLVAEAGWHPRLEFAMHGEPTLNPHAEEIIECFRAYLPRASIMMTSNGGGLLGKEHRIDKLFESGLNVLALDNYEYVSIIPKLEANYRGSVPIRRYPQEPGANPHSRRHPTVKEIVIIQDISVATSGTHSTLNNHAGTAFPKNNKAQGAPCAKPFRELSIRWDGNIAICCNDWRGEFKCGNIMDTMDIHTIWDGIRFDAARRHLLRGQRIFDPCRGCDAKSYRPGLLPDAKGVEFLGEATEEHEQAIREATSGPSYTQKVERPWELTVEGKSI